MYFPETLSERACVSYAKLWVAEDDWKQLYDEARLHSWEEFRLVVASPLRAGGADVTIQFYSLPTKEGTGAILFCEAKRGGMGVRTSVPDELCFAQLAICIKRRFDSLSKDKTGILPLEDGFKFSWSPGNGHDVRKVGLCDGLKKVGGFVRETVLKAKVVLAPPPWRQKEHLPAQERNALTYCSIYMALTSNPDPGLFERRVEPDVGLVIDLDKCRGLKKLIIRCSEIQREYLPRICEEVRWSLGQSVTDTSVESPEIMKMIAGLQVGMITKRGTTGGQNAERSVESEERTRLRTSGKELEKLWEQSRAACSSELNTKANKIFKSVQKVLAKHSVDRYEPLTQEILKLADEIRADVATASSSQILRHSPAPRGSRVGINRHRPVEIQERTRLRKVSAEVVARLARLSIFGPLPDQLTIQVEQSRKESDALLKNRHKLPEEELALRCTELAETMAGLLTQADELEPRSP